MATPRTSASARRDVDATTADVFALLTDPSRHHEIDASGTVGDADTPARLIAAGQVFTMQMRYRRPDGRIERYRTDNRVTLFALDRLLEWSVAPHGQEPLGWGWRYEVLSTPGGSTVVLTYDWSGTSEQNLVRYGVPAFDEDDLRESLDRLADVVGEG